MTAPLKLPRYDAPPKLKHDSFLYWGYILLLISAGLYAIEETLETGVPRNSFGVFFVHYAIALAYTAMLLVDGSVGVLRSWSKENIHRTVVVLNLFLVSAYALNREIGVFDQSTTWLCAYLITCSLVLLSFAWYSHLPPIINALQHVVLGSAILFYLYLVIYCATFYGFGAFGLLAVGIGGHIFVPLFFLIAAVALFRQNLSPRPGPIILCGVGFVVTVFLIVGFVLMWNARINAIQKIETQSFLEPQTELPIWLRVAISVPNDRITERILKTDLVYKVYNSGRRTLMSSGRTWSEERLHDPLVYIATYFRPSPLSREERLKILEALTFDRHNAQERLWSGDNLVTSNIITDAEIYSDLRLAYTETYLSIRNTSHNGRGAPREAIYTFQLPEGSVVTSLSLWINGKEEKAILTSKQKANLAYKTIVGVESRDPSVVHWQEGNTVTVRIFPCNTEEDRKFKLGITSPLGLEDGRVIYKSVTFRGPAAFGADEVVRIRFNGHPSELTLPDGFERNEKGEFIREQRYDPALLLSFKADRLRENHFTFNGFTYSVSKLEQMMVPMVVSEVYLDINRTWSSKELEALHPLITRYRVFVNDDASFVPLTETNWTARTSVLLQRNFSMFPFYRVGNVASSLVVSKGQALSPFLADFQDSKFASLTSTHFRANRQVFVYNLSSSASTYIRSLRELRAIHYASGTAERLLELLNKEEFPIVHEDEQRIALQDAGMVINKVPASHTVVNNNAPDHLARLFAYNSIMRQAGPNYFADEFISDALIQEATTAYVVSPVSSLVVLETKRDYDRFGIEESNNSLRNATRLSSGAVPEPHEWALISIFGALVMYCIQKQWRQRIALSK